MAKLVTKFKYLKPNKKAKGGYARYIATRDGVEMIDDSQIHEPATSKQRKLIDKISKDFPEVKSMLEYEDYTAKCDLPSERFNNLSLLRYSYAKNK